MFVDQLSGELRLINMFGLLGIVVDTMMSGMLMTNEVSLLGKSVCRYWLSRLAGELSACMAPGLFPNSDGRTANRIITAGVIIVD